MYVQTPLATVVLPRKPEPLYISIRCPSTPVPVNIGRRTEVMRSDDENPESDEEVKTGGDADGAAVSMSTVRPTERVPMFPARSESRAEITCVPSAKTPLIGTSAKPASTSC